jgi:hypothetical protein
MKFFFRTQPVVEKSVLANISASFEPAGLSTLTYLLGEPEQFSYLYRYRPLTIIRNGFFHVILAYTGTGNRYAIPGNFFTQISCTGTYLTVMPSVSDPDPHSVASLDQDPDPGV